jgi:hypothetical protein
VVSLNIFIEEPFLIRFFGFLCPFEIQLLVQLGLGQGKTGIAFHGTVQLFGCLFGYKFGQFGIANLASLLAQIFYGTYEVNDSRKL